MEHPSTPREAVTAFRHTWDDHPKALMAMLAVVGDAGSSELLRAYADDGGNLGLRPSRRSST
jgi:hypothetical protein